VKLTELAGNKPIWYTTVTQPLTANATRTVHYKMNTADSSTHTDHHTKPTYILYF